MAGALPPSAVAKASPARDAGYLPRLEALRGIAAMMVAAGHSWMVFEMVGWQAPVKFVCLTLGNGRAAVTMFFVLSGLVLGLALRRMSGPPVRELIRYGLRRVLRMVSSSAM